MQPQTHTSIQKGARWRQNCLFQPQWSFNWLWDYTEGLGILKEGQWIALIKKKKTIHCSQEFAKGNSLCHENWYCTLSELWSKKRKKMFLLLWLGKHNKVAISISCKVKVTLSIYRYYRYSGFTQVFFLSKFFQVYTTSEISYKILNRGTEARCSSEAADFLEQWQYLLLCLQIY